MTVSFPEHLHLLASHGQAVGACLDQLSRRRPLPPRGDLAHRAVAEYWATLEIWAYSLDNPATHWSQRTEPRVPAKYAALAAGVGAELIRLEAALLRAGPKGRVDYFGRPGTTAEVARLLAHESIALAHAVRLAAGLVSPPVTPSVARDGIDQALGHWESLAGRSPERADVAAIQTSDTHDTWYLELFEAPNGDETEFRLVAPAAPAAVVEGPATGVLWWAHGHADPAGGVEVHGTAETISRLRSALMHPEPELPKRRRWFGR